ncbi:hypothetical protein BDV29DRAFT_162045 [Aspergillus leporis]|uniref:Uncharacterized protein n=1 Tax=Aspergillus leporis TaxID=41062 RepID=A0A5N5WJS7_9EURO|nr:hypothetical protein BDV29DRAFT_162045 [Aspergillus leporis]
MFGLKQISFLGLALALCATSAAKGTTTVGFETAEGSTGKTVPFDECHDVDMEEVNAVYTSHFCRVFTGPDCIGRQTLLNPGEHVTEDPVPFITSVFCHS